MPGQLTLGRGVMAVALTLALAILGTTASGQDGPPTDTPKTGLMWNRSGLPAVFPLQVKTLPGRNYYLTLRDVESGRDVLAAFIRGGAFFRVLVPPGTFSVRFAFGREWQGEERLFGPGTLTGILEIEKPLTFATRGLGTKAGHLIDLRRDPQGQLALGDIRGQSICQTRMAEIGFDRDPWFARDPLGRPAARAPDQSLFQALYRSDRRTDIGLGAYPHPVRTPDFRRRSRYCD